MKVTIEERTEGWAQVGGVLSEHGVAVIEMFSINNVQGGGSVLHKEGGVFVNKSSSQYSELKLSPENLIVIHENINLQGCGY